MDRLTVYIDGASRGNPGRASIGIAIYSESGSRLKKCGASIGEATNNVAEYMALITALAECLPLNSHELEIKSDSQLLVRQMQGVYKVKDCWLRKLHFIAKRLAAGYNKVIFTYIPREENREADKIANSYMDEAPAGLF